MASHYLFDPDFCNVASGWEKGVVEKNVQDSRRRIWQAAANVRFASFAELNVWLESRCQALWSELPYPEIELAATAVHRSRRRNGRAIHRLFGTKVPARAQRAMRGASIEIRQNPERQTPTRAVPE
jgi:hypothetical protein